MLLLLALFVFSSSIAGLVLMAKSSRATADNMRGLKKMAVFTSVLAACVVVQFVYSVMESQVNFKV